jgi:hypothetical protein
VVPDLGSLQAQHAAQFGSRHIIDQQTIDLLQGQARVLEGRDAGDLEKLIR